jgi:ParB family transcriptional regulator, chromosome partitioning protein
MPQLNSKTTSARVRILPGETKHSLRVIDVPLSSCRRNPDQPRQTFDKAGIRELADSIERHGLLQPITVKRDPKNKQGFVVVAGERRFRAFELLGRETIPAVVTSGNADEIALIENLQREDLHPIEEAQALEKLKDKYGYTQEEVGKAVGKDRTTITHLLKLNDLPRKIKEESVTSHVVSKSLLIELSKVADPKKQLSLWKDIKERGVTVRQARAKKQDKEQRQVSESQRTLTSGKRFVADLERLASEEVVFDRDKYEELLMVYRRFMAFMDQQASKQKQGKKKK